MRMNVIDPNDIALIHVFHVNSDNEEIIYDAEANEIIYKLLKSFMNNYQEKKEALRNRSNLLFKSTDFFFIVFAKSERES